MLRWRTFREVKFQLVIADSGETGEKVCSQDTVIGSTWLRSMLYSGTEHGVCEGGLLDCVCACFKDSYSVTWAHTTEATNKEESVCVWAKRVGKSASSGAECSFSYQVDLDHYCTATYRHKHTRVPWFPACLRWRGMTWIFFPVKLLVYKHPELLC